jgi:hypothetical protein
VIGAGGLNNADSGKNEGLKKIIDSTSRKLFTAILLQAAVQSVLSNIDSGLIAIE